MLRTFAIVNLKLYWKSLCYLTTLHLQVGKTAATVRTIWLVLFTWILSMNVKVSLSENIFLFFITDEIEHISAHHQHSAELDFCQLTKVNKSERLLKLS